jgi:hypothetical protein
MVGFVNSMVNVPEIWDSHGGEDVNCGLLDCDAVLSCMWLPNTGSHKTNGVTIQKSTIGYDEIPRPTKEGNFQPSVQQRTFLFKLHTVELIDYGRECMDCNK